jgi:heat shock protein HslJ
MNTAANASSQRHYIWLGLLLVLAILLVSCGGGGPEPTAEPVTTEQALEPTPTTIPPAPTPVPVVDLDQIQDQLWVLVGYGDAIVPTVVERDTVISLVFSSDGTVSGSSGCNNYTSTYEIQPDGSLMVVSPLAATMMHCPKGMDQEQAYITSLLSAQSVSINSEGRLEIIYESGQPFEEKLIYVEGETPLVGTQWILVGHGDPGSPTLVEAGTTITAIFSEDGNVTGSGGCNYYAGSYETQDDQMSVGPLAATGKICPIGDQQEMAYLDALGKAQTYQLFGQRLSISYDDGQGLLTYTSANLPLEGTLWTLMAVQGEPLLEGIAITAVFEPGEDDQPGSVAGSAGCNTYNSAYEVDGEQLRIETPAVTRKACEVGMEEEVAYLAAIEGDHAYQIIGDNMDIQTEFGTLTYVADRTPLIGALWVLVALGDVDEPQPPVEGSNFTAQFSRNLDAPSGVVAGTTGCNEYSAAYTANVNEIKINLPDMANRQVCSPGMEEQEQQFFLGINAAREYSILGNTLLMPYDEGRQVLVFAATQTQVAGKRPLSDLDGTQWYLHFINDSPVIPGTTIDALFTINPDGAAGRIAGSAGCNSYNAAFTQEIGVQTSLSSSSICFTPEGVMDQENNYLNALNRAYGYWLTNNQLVINTGLGALTYRQAPPDSSQDQAHLLQNVKWYLANYNDKPSVVGNAEPFLFFNLDNTYFGNTGCNGVSGGYATNLENISFSNIDVGDAACPDDTSDKQQRVTLANLEAALTYIVADTGMQIASDQGVLTYSTTPVQRPEPTEPPTAVIVAPEEASVGQIVRFDGSTSTSEIGITNYRWLFGDGGLGEGPIVEHIYIEPGTFQVTLEVIDKVGGRGSAEQPINIIAQPPEQVPPTAVIDGPIDGFVAEPVTFSAEGSSSGSSPISSFTWDFGDGTGSPASPNTSVTTLYENPGTFTVTVTATDANGLSDSDSLQIEIDTRLEGPVWSLYPVLERTAITMQFLQGDLAGFSGCNTYSGSYIAEDNGDGTFQVTISDLVSTQLLCADDLMEQETEYMAVLAATTGGFIEGNLLTLTGPESDLTYYEVGTLKPELLQ